MLPFILIDEIIGNTLGGIWKSFIQVIIHIPSLALINLRNSSHKKCTSMVFYQPGWGLGSEVGLVKDHYFLLFFCHPSLCKQILCEVSLPKHWLVFCFGTIMTAKKLIFHSFSFHSFSISVHNERGSFPQLISIWLFSYLFSDFCTMVVFLWFSYNAPLLAGK